MTIEMDPAQIRGARGMLDWSMSDLSKAASVSVANVRRMETDGAPAVPGEVCRAVRAALEGAGIRMVDDLDGGIGVTMARR